MRPSFLYSVFFLQLDKKSIQLFQSGGGHILYTEKNGDVSALRMRGISEAHEIIQAHSELTGKLNFSGIIRIGQIPLPTGNGVQRNMQLLGKLALC